LTFDDLFVNLDLKLAGRVSEVVKNLEATRELFFRSNRIK